MTLELTRSEGKQRLSFWKKQDYSGGFVYLIQGERRTPVKLGYLADQAVQFFLATGRVPRLEALDGWHELVDAARPPEAHLTPPDVMAYPPSIGWTNRRQRTTKFFPR